MAVSDHVTFSDFGGSGNENVGENRKEFDETLPPSVVDAYPSTSSIDHSQESLKSIFSSRITPMSKNWKLSMEERRHQTA